MNKVTFMCSFHLTSHNIIYDYIFLSLTPTPIHQQVLSALLLYIDILTLNASVSVATSLVGDQHLLPRVSNSLPTDLPASNPFSTQQPDGTSSKQPPYDGHRALLTRSAPVCSSPITPLFTLLLSRWLPYYSWNTRGWVLLQRLYLLFPPPETLCPQKAAFSTLGSQVKCPLQRTPPWLPNLTYLPPPPARVLSILPSPNLLSSQHISLSEITLFTYLFVFSPIQL